MTNLSFTIHWPSFIAGLVLGCIIFGTLFLLVEIAMAYSEKEDSAFGRGWSKGYDYGRNMKKLAEEHKTDA